ncbi:hypothetical protein [uncultured Formosa sp.]|uniref:hypothetical protein n=1 Tax=uncultured Formosa sp. TaxID=255435 RepID=UPI00260D64E1|nr:hypothetical protein [uncultured Formosa sp.]
MKKISQILLTLFTLILITGCDSDNNNDEETSEDVSINSKWIVSNSSEYESFEFNESGNYIIVKNTEEERTTDTETILFGTYNLIDASTVILSDFGTLLISDIDEDSINFSIALTNNPESEIEIKAYKNAEFENSTNTDLLCRTWQMETFNGENVIGTVDDLTVIFSRAGTYFVTYTSPLSENEGGLAKWYWSNNKQTELYYSWDKGEDSDGIVKITELTPTSLIIDEDGDISVLTPKSTYRTTTDNTSNATDKDIIKTGLFKK